MPNNARGVNRDISENGTAWDQIRRERKVRKSTHGGNSETAIGKALAGWQGRKIFIQTKTPWYQDKPLDEFRRLLDAALKKLGTAPIDFYLHHSISLDMFKKKGKAFIKFTDQAMKQGLIRFRGMSVHDSPANIKKLIDTGEFAVMLISYNLLNPVMRDTIAYASERGMGVSVMNPVGGGVLAVDTPKIRGLLPGAKTSAEASLRFALATPGVDVAMSGMNTLAQVAENAAIAARPEPLTPRQWRTMNARLAARCKVAERFCTRCGYCLPCPSGVDIPANFLLYNETRLYGLEAYGRRGFKGLRQRKEGDASALACTRCGRCLPKCPQKIPIIAQLARVARRFRTAASL
jgi:predicted aldo/keto reductase-like oxidoreductase